MVGFAQIRANSSASFGYHITEKEARMRTKHWFMLAIILMESLGKHIPELSVQTAYRALYHTAWYLPPAPICSEKNAQLPSRNIPINSPRLIRGHANNFIALIFFCFSCVRLLWATQTCTFGVTNLWCKRQFIDRCCFHAKHCFIVVSLSRQETEDKQATVAQELSPNSDYPPEIIIPWKGVKSWPVLDTLLGRWLAACNQSAARLAESRTSWSRVVTSAHGSRCTAPS